MKKLPNITYIFNSPVLNPVCSLHKEVAFVNNFAPIFASECLPRVDLGLFFSFTESAEYTKVVFGATVNIFKSFHRFSKKLWLKPRRGFHVLALNLLQC